MLTLITGKPGASKTLHALTELVESNDGSRPIYYNNISNLMLDMEFIATFRGFFYGYYLRRNKIEGKLKRIVDGRHGQNMFVEFEDVLWLQGQFEAYDPVANWCHYVEKVYPKKQLQRYFELREMSEGELTFSMLKPLNLHFTHFKNPLQWYELPTQSKILIDECQQFFPPRRVGSDIPQAIAEVETHRHKGWDLFYITQDPKLIDVNLRRLTGCHVHYHNKLGGKRVVRHQKPEVFAPDDWMSMKSTVKTYPKHNKKMYGVYHSAFKHTHRLNIPFIAKVAMLFIVAFIGFGAYKAMTFGDDIVTAPDGSVMVIGDSQTQSVQTKPIQKSHQPITDYMSEYVSTLVEGVFITGSVKALVNNYTRYSYVFSYENGDVFYPENVGMKVIPINDCFVELAFADYRTFVTCNPVKKYEQPEQVKDNELELANTLF
ncbi:zonular occludens toxin domain-containing protein [Thaumasiovibrio subtropicus]|uniref:zonular occludens toxin domain-containing protein n=1 Tax=Thaumasiovibrio subtropicus TaxID=1891207 RepID=UPI000B35C7E7|nr:zonular occludens toxin domain-containing protein [Thaumasiovibrio subtropicus]